MRMAKKLRNARNLGSGLEENRPAAIAPPAPRRMDFVSRILCHYHDFVCSMDPLPSPCVQHMCSMELADLRGGIDRPADEPLRVGQVLELREHWERQNRAPQCGRPTSMPGT